MRMCKKNYHSFANRENWVKWQWHHWKLFISPLPIYPGDARFCSPTPLDWCSNRSCAGSFEQPVHQKSGACNIQIHPSTKISFLVRHTYMYVHMHKITHQVNFANLPVINLLYLSNLLTTHSPFTISYQGHPRLVRALAAMYGQLMKREIDPMNEVCTLECRVALKGIP